MIWMWGYSRGPNQAECVFVLLMYTVECASVYLSIKHHKVFQHGVYGRQKRGVRWCLWVCRPAGRPLPNSSGRQEHHTELNKMELTRELVAVARSETSVSTAIRCYNVWITWGERRKSKDVINRPEIHYHTNKSVWHLKHRHTRKMGALTSHKPRSAANLEGGPYKP